MSAQELSGVIFKKSKPVSGLVVSVKDASVITDNNGRFYFKEASSGDILQINVSKRKAARIMVSDARRLKIYIASGDFVLNNGILESRMPYTALSSDAKISGNVVSHEQIIGSGLKRVTDIIRHHMSGIEVNQSFAESTIRVRGINSVGAGNNPLIVVDGIDYGDVDVDALIPVEEIERIELHKDGSRWGARGANGVIEINTIKKNLL